MPARNQAREKIAGGTQYGRGLKNVDIRFVQDLLGHSNIKTTIIYTGLTDQAKHKIKSPLDNL